MHYILQKRNRSTERKLEVSPNFSCLNLQQALDIFSDTFPLVTNQTSGSEVQNLKNKKQKKKKKAVSETSHLDKIHEINHGKNINYLQISETVYLRTVASFVYKPHSERLCLKKMLSSNVRGMLKHISVFK